MVESAAAEPAQVLREQRSDGVYTALRVRPDWSKVPLETREPPRHFVFALDTSRSSLEERKLSLEALRSALSALSPTHSFLLVTHDLDVRIDARGFSLATPENIRAALDFVGQAAADGATDLGTLLEVGGRIVHGMSDASLVYIGDCEPSWGLLEPSELSQRARTALGTTPFNPLLIGAAGDSELGRALAQATGGRFSRAEHAEDAAEFVRRLSRPSARLPEVDVNVRAGSQVFPSGKLALESGEDLLLLVKTPSGQEALDVLEVRANVGGQEQSLLAKAAPAATPFVAQRFGSELIRSLERQGKPQAEVISASLGYGVMSKYTSFLVLESEEAYARFAIERRAQSQGDSPRVSGADLSSADSDGATVSLDRIQPGDPEIAIDAPRDCQSVRVVFSFGESKLATFDSEARGGRGAWLVRFLVDRDTPEGSYDALAYIVFADGRRELRKVSYVVDHTAPELDVKVRRAPRRAGFLEVLVTQRGPEAERDLRRVEVRAHDGRVLSLTAIRWGEFRGYLPAAGLGHTRLRVAGFDQALNHVSLEVTLP
ncbi:MAG: hypothetical protein QM756_38370 [Polyangiaceae bacterium]